MTQSGTGLHSSNVLRCVVSDIVELVELNNQVAVLATESEAGVAVASRLGRNLDAELLAALDRVLDVLGGLGDRDGGRKVREANVERGNILVPAISALGVDWDFGIRETLLNGSSRNKRIGRRGNEAGGKKGSDAHAGQQCSDCDLQVDIFPRGKL